MLTLVRLPSPRSRTPRFTWFSDIRVRVLQDGTHVGDITGGWLDLRIKAGILQMLRIRPPEVSLHHNALALISPQGTVQPLSVLDGVSPAPPAGILRIDLLRMRPGFSGQNLGLNALRQFVHEAAGAPCVVQLKAYPLARPQDPQFPEGSPAERRALLAQLLAHYARIGVRPITGDGMEDPGGLLPVWCQACVPDAHGWLPTPRT